MSSRRLLNSALSTTLGFLLAGSSAAAATPVVRNGQLRVINNKLCNAAGTPVQLRGISTHGIQWYPFVPNTTLPNMVQLMDFDVLRVAMYVESASPWNPADIWNGYMTQPDNMKTWTKNYVEEALRAGIYVIVDWHIHNDPSKFTQEAKAFFQEMSAAYGSYPNVIYELCNEPIGTMPGITAVPWSTIKNYAEEIIPVIRANDPDNLIIVGTPTFSQDVDVAAADPIPNVSNVMYTLHFYAASHHEANRDKVRNAVGKIPIFCTEFGTSDYAGLTNDTVEAKTWLDLLASNNISWVNWSMSNKDETHSILLPAASMAGPWTRDSLRPNAGQWIYDNYIKRDQQALDLAQGHPATASSVEGSGTLSASMAVDGQLSTRWSSVFADPQWITVDLGQTYNLNKVVLAWEAAYGKDYEIRVSDDNRTWKSLYSSQNAGKGGTESLSVTGQGRYVQMYGKARGTQWGYSLWAFQVYGTEASKGTLSATPTALTFPSAGGTSTVTVSSDQTWSVATSDAWLTLPSTTGQGNGTFSVTALPNTTTTGRQGTLTLSAPGLSNISISLSQDPSGNVLPVSVKAQAGSGSGPWYAEDQAVLSTTSQLTDVSLTISAAKTAGATINGQYDTTGGAFAFSSSSSSNTLSYTFTLKPGQSLPAGTYTLVAQMGLTGTPHGTTGDTWSLTYGSNGQTKTLTGKF